MHRTILIALLLASLAVPASATFSIVARDPQTGEIGVAVQSHWFAVGQVVAWAEPGVGAVATQANVEPSYGPLGLQLMRSGKNAGEALNALLAGDANAPDRQIAMIDSSGVVAVFTGKRTIAAAGDHAGTQYSVQANMMRSDAVWPAMAKAFEATKGDLAERLLAALEAGQRAGGDLRGKQSAALIVVQGTRSATPWRARTFDLRVDDSPDPIGELRRLVRLQRAYNHMNRGDELAAGKKWDAAMKEYDAGAKLAPEIEELRYWVAVTLFSAGREEEALPIFKEVFAKNRDYIELTKRLPASELLPNDQAKMKRILEQGR